MGEKDKLPEKMSEDDERRFRSMKKTGYRVHSRKDISYNCVAYAAGDETRQWTPVARPKPGYHWPVKINPGDDPDSIDALRIVFETIGYEVCTNGNLEAGYQKIALYADSKKGDWSHAAKQNTNGEWASKLGDEEDVVHKTPHCFGDSYGTVIYFMKKRIDEGKDEKNNLEEAPAASKEAI